MSEDEDMLLIVKGQPTHFELFKRINGVLAPAIQEVA